MTMAYTFTYKDTKIVVVEPSVVIMTPYAQIKEYPKMIETAGRTCYKSDDAITATSSEMFIKGLIKNGHLSVLEHLSITVKFIGDRSMSHQLVRHRIAAYSMESQRYCNYNEQGFQVILPPSIHDDDCNYELWKESVGLACTNYCRLIKNHVPPEDARSILPNAMKTEIVTTFNLRQWRHVFRLRALSLHAQWQIRELMQTVLRTFNELLPEVFHDQFLLLEMLKVLNK